jgi:hypothetical protein
MIRRFTLTILAAALLVGSASAGALAARPHLKMYANYNRGARWYNANTQWHGPYAHSQWSQPMALMAPPNANMQSSWSWGVGRTRMVPNYHQFTRPYVAPGGAAGSTSPAPNWPSSTTDQGIYYIRAPW